MSPQPYSKQAARLLPSEARSPHCTSEKLISSFPFQNDAENTSERLFCLGRQGREEPLGTIQHCHQGSARPTHPRN